MNWENIQTVIQICPVAAFFNSLDQVSIGSGDQPYLHLDGFCTTHPLKFVFLQDSQKLDLDLLREIADLVQKDRALVG